jgi:hypothetical protein
VRGVLEVDRVRAVDLVVVVALEDVEQQRGYVDSRPRWGLIPTRFVQAAGIRMEPAPSDPSPAATIPAATAAAVPPLLPPGVRSRAHGLRV